MHPSHSLFTFNYQSPSHVDSSSQWLSNPSVLHLTDTYAGTVTVAHITAEFPTGLLQPCPSSFMSCPCFRLFSGSLWFLQSSATPLACKVFHTWVLLNSSVLLPYSHLPRAGPLSHICRSASVLTPWTCCALSTFFSNFFVQNSDQVSPHLGRPMEFL